MNDNEWAQTPEDIQGGKAWHDWRNKGLGASDAPIVMRMSPWKTPYQLWLQKTERLKDEKQNWAQSRGHKLEGVARQKFEKLNDASYPAKTFENGIFRASLDGWNTEQNIGLEIKCTGLEDHQTARDGKVPKKYRYQLVHQFLVTDAKAIVYASYYCPKDIPDDKGELICVMVNNPGHIELAEYQKDAVEFWKHVQNDTPPEMTDRDWLPIDDIAIKTCADVYVEKLEEYDLAKARLDASKSLLIDQAKQNGWVRVTIGNLRIQQIVKKGTIDWKRFQDENVALTNDVESYRKKDSVYYKITLGGSDGKAT